MLAAAGIIVVETISMYLTTILYGICYIGYFVLVRREQIWNLVMEWTDIISTFVLPAGSFIFQASTLFTHSDDSPLSGRLEIVAFLVYGITAIVIGRLLENASEDSKKV